MFSSFFCTPTKFYSFSDRDGEWNGTKKQTNNKIANYFSIHNKHIHTLEIFQTTFFYILQIVANRFLICDILPHFFLKRKMKILFAIDDLVLVTDESYWLEFIWLHYKHTHTHTEWRRIWWRWKKTRCFLRMRWLMIIMFSLPD